MTTTEENTGPRHVKFFRITPQIKTFKKETVLKNKVDLYYSLEEDIVETGSDDGWSPLVGTASGNSFGSGSEFIAKETTLLLVEAAQFRASNDNIYVRAQLLSGEKVVWVNIANVPNRIWSFLIRSEQKKMIENELTRMFDVLIESSGEIK